MSESVLLSYDFVRMGVKLYSSFVGGWLSGILFLFRMNGRAKVSSFESNM